MERPTFGKVWIARDDVVGLSFERNLQKQVVVDHLDRLVGIGVGSLCESICKRLDDVDAESPTAAGHGQT